MAPVNELELQVLRREISSVLARLQHAFLVVDDIEMCSSNLFSDLQSELRKMRWRGMHVMTTSGLTIWHQNEEFRCDRFPVIDHAKILRTLYWCCSCDFRDDLLDDEPYILYQDCKDLSRSVHKCHKW